MEVEPETTLDGDGMTQTLETGQPYRSQEEQVADLLREAASPAKPEAEKPPQDAPEPIEKWDVKSLAEKLGVDPAKFYDLKVKASDGSDLTVGELKDRYKASAEIDSLKAEVTKARGELEADRLRQQRELNELLSVMDQRAIRPELVTAYQKQMADYRSRELESLLRAIPEWAEPAVATAERKQIDALLGEAGFPSGTVDQFEDHRAFRFMRQAARDRAELEKLRKAQAEAEKPKPKVGIATRTAKPQTEAQRFGQLKASVTTGRKGKVDAVAELLKGIK